MLPVVYLMSGRGGGNSDLLFDWFHDIQVVFDDETDVTINAECDLLIRFTDTDALTLLAIALLVAALVFVAFAVLIP